MICYSVFSVIRVARVRKRYVDAGQMAVAITAFARSYGRVIRKKEASNLPFAASLIF